MIHSTGFFRNKANSLIGLGAAVVEKHDGVLPHTLDELVEAARDRPQDGQRDPGQRLRRARHHRGHPLRPAGPALGLDRRGGPGQGRARGRGAGAPAGLDDRVAPGDLPRPAGLPREEAGLRGLHAELPTARRTAPGRRIRCRPARCSPARPDRTCSSWSGWASRRSRPHPDRSRTGTRRDGRGPSRLPEPGMRVAARRSEIVSTVLVVLLGGAGRVRAVAARRGAPGRRRSTGGAIRRPGSVGSASDAELAPLRAAAAAGRPARRRPAPRRPARWPAVTVPCLGAPGRVDLGAGAGRPVRRCSTSGRPGARRAAPSCPRWPGTRPGPAPCRCSASTCATTRGPRWPCWTSSV